MSPSREHEGSNSAFSDIPVGGSKSGSCSLKYALARLLRVQLLQESASTVAHGPVAVVKASGRCGDRPGVATLAFLTRDHERKAVWMMPISLREHSANRRAGPRETVGHGLTCLRCASALYRSSSGREVRAPMWRWVSRVGARRYRRVLAFGQGEFAWSGVSACARDRRQGGYAWSGVRALSRCS